MLNVCETFGCTPSEAWAELYERNPAGWVTALMGIRSFRMAHEQLKRDPEQKHVDPGVWHERVLTAESELAARELKRRRERRRGSS